MPGNGAIIITRKCPSFEIWLNFGRSKISRDKYRRRMLANAFASRLSNIQEDDIARDRQKLQARNTYEETVTSISFRRIIEAVREPHGKDQRLLIKDRKQERIRGIMLRSIP